VHADASRHDSRCGESHDLSGPAACSATGRRPRPGRPEAPPEGRARDDAAGDDIAAAHARGHRPGVAPLRVPVDQEQPAADAMHVPQVPACAHPRHDSTQEQAADVVVLLVAEDRLPAAPQQGSVCEQGH